MPISPLNDPGLELPVGAAVGYVGEVGGIDSPLGVVSRPRRYNSLTGVYAYGVTFPSGYFLVDETRLIPI